MANGSNHARLGRNIVSRKATRDRLLILGCIAAVGWPGVLRTSAQDLPLLTSQVEGSPVPIAQAIALGDPQPADAVSQTAGGVLDQIFGSQSAAPKGAKDDGRKAYPLPPPDPSAVNWSGIPYHRPTPGPIAETATQNERPIRDIQSNTGARISSSHGTPAAGASAIQRGLPQPPPSGSPQAGTAAARVATATPLPQPKLPPATAASELSTNSSSRRSGRRPIDPLSSDELLPAMVEVSAEAPQPGLDFESVARRTLESAAAATTATPQPKQPSLPSPPTTQTVIDSKPAAAVPSATLPTTAVPTAPAPAPVPPSLAAIDAKMASQQAQRDPAVQTRSPEIPQADPTLQTSSEAKPNAVKPNAVKPNEYIGSGVANRIENDAVPSAALSDKLTGNTAGEPVGAAGEPVGAAGEPVDFVARGQLSERPQKSEQASGLAGTAKGKQLAASELPGIRVVTEGPSEILIRELTQYEVRVENRGSLDASGVVIHTSLPPWAEVKGHNASGGVVEPVADDKTGQLQWTLNSLPAGVVERLFVRVKPIRSGSFEVATSWRTMPVTHTAQVMVREPKLAIEIDGPDEIIYGQSQKYRVRVLNPGDAAASNVLFTLVPEVGDAVKQTIGNIPAGKEASFEIELTARDLEQLKINGTVTADLELKAVAKKSVVVATALIEATLSGPPLKFQNSDAAYHLQLTNSGRALSDAVTGELHLPDGIKYLGGIEGARIEGQRLIWTIGELPPGKTREYNFTCKMEHTGNHPIAFHCTGSAAGQASVGIDTAVQAIVDLKLLVIDPPAPAAVGSEVFYEVVINNRGSKAAEDVRVVAQFGNGIEPVRVEGHAGDMITGQVLFNSIPRIQAGDQVKLRIAAKADRPGDHRFRAEVRSGETVLVAEEATLFVEIRNERVSRSSSEPAKR